MSNNYIPELAYLLSEVEKKYGRKIATSTDFEALSVIIEHQTREHLSSSTLKRLWGYVTLNPTPRISTLDILSRYIGHQNFKAFCQSLTDSKAFSSTFFTARYLAVSELPIMSKVIVGWAPNRIVEMRYLGEITFEVEKSIHSKLKEGDRFELSDIILGYPMFISRILRNGEYTPSYIAGRNEGINLLKVE
jgi:hypothetical protein